MGGDAKNTVLSAIAFFLLLAAIVVSDTFFIPLFAFIFLVGAGTVLGVETDVCDDDGDGRKSLQIWTGRQVDFWITMDHYGKLRLVE